MVGGWFESQRSYPGRAREGHENGRGRGNSVLIREKSAEAIVPVQSGKGRTMDAHTVQGESVLRRQNTTEVGCPVEDRLEAEGPQGAPSMESGKEGTLGAGAAHPIRKVAGEVACFIEPPYAERHVRWCGRGRGKPRPLPD